MDDLFADAEVISTYTTEQAVEDGIKVYLFENRWDQLSGGKPITATASLVEAFSPAAFIEMWNELVESRKAGSTDPMFTTQMNGEDIWLIEDGECFTFLRPSEY